AHFIAGGRLDGAGGFLQRDRIARSNSHDYAFFGKLLGDSPAHASATAENQCLLSCDAKIHGLPHTLRSSGEDQPYFLSSSSSLTMRRPRFRCSSDRPRKGLRNSPAGRPTARSKDLTATGLMAEYVKCSIGSRFR